MKIYVVPNTTIQKAVQVAGDVIEVLLRDGAELLTDTERARFLGHPGLRVMGEEEAYEACDIVLSVGGDGTMLRVARQTMFCQKPMLGVNTGRLGFLTAVESNELDKLHRLAKGEYSVEHRSVLQASLQGEGGGVFCRSLNDVVLFKESPERSISLDIHCDDILVSRFRGDGVIFATPTGSTAYSMSAGGPILDAKLGGIVVTQICAHIVHTPPMVFSSSRVLRAKNTGNGKENICISSDGTKRAVLHSGEEVEIRQSDLSVPLIHFKDSHQLESIDKKLKGR